MLLYNKKGELFIGERSDRRGHWQFPQGGAEPRYSLRQNVVRELKEELGIPRRTLGSIRKLKATHEYEWRSTPPYAKRRWRGQSQTFWAVEFVGADSEIDLFADDSPEFLRWRWASVATVRRVADSRRLKGYDGALKEYIALRRRGRR